MATLEAVKSFTIKKENGNITYPLCQSQYLVEPIRGISGINNLEEQNILGLTYILTEVSKTDDDSKTTTTVHYCTDNDKATVKHYITITESYKTPQTVDIYANVVEQSKLYYGLENNLGDLIHTKYIIETTVQDESAKTITKTKKSIMV